MSHFVPTSPAWRTWTKRCNKDPRVPCVCFNVPCLKYQRKWMDITDYEIWCDLKKKRRPCMSECCVSCLPKCQIPLQFPTPDPPIRLIRDLGPMQGPSGRAPFAPPPFMPCTGPPTPIGAVVGPCPLHGDVATTPELIPWMELPLVSQQTPCHCQSMMNCATFQF